MRRFSVLLLLGACGSGSGDDVAPIDAPHNTVDASPTATTCGSPVPTTAGATLTLSGQLEDSDGSGNGVAGATVMAFGAGVARGTAISEQSGLYQVSATTGGKPVDYLTLAGTGRRATRVYFAAPFDHTTTIETMTFYATADLATYLAPFGVTQDPGKGIAIVSVSDCFDSKKANATVSVTPPGTAVVKYLHADGSTTGTSTDATGVAVVFNVGGTVTIGATVSGTPYHEYAIAADPSYLVVATIAER